ncbi:MAG: exodeoxyribonuclease VII large subunit [Rhodothermales bacterium]
MTLQDNQTIFTVSDLAGSLKEMVETHFDDVWVEGELSNFRQYRSGHAYFTLKDEDAQLRCVMWKGVARYVFFEPQDGMLVRIHGHASVYEPRGELQLVTRSMQLAGEGALQKAFEELKQRLSDEGLFAPEHKRPLPPYPETIGIITSGDGAALHDILSILRRRFPQVRVLVCPVHVQGLGASEEIAEAITTFNALPPGDPFRPDVLIVGRGGGSAEDLWAFNEERVARAIFAARIPVISAVGHETDYSISDFVADVRAATPSMAAELVVPHRRDVATLVRGLYAYLHDRTTELVVNHRQRILALTRSYSFHRPVEQLRREQQRLDALTARLHRSARHTLQRERQRLETTQHRLEILDPRRPLERGYARVEREETPIRNAADLHPGDRVTLHFLDGTRDARIEE